MGPDMEIIGEISIQEKMSILSSLTTLTINIHKILHSWTDFQHQLAVTDEAIVEVCVQKILTIRLQPMKTKHIIMTTRTVRKIFVAPCFFETKKHFVHGGDVGGASW